MHVGQFWLFTSSADIRRYDKTYQHFVTVFLQYCVSIMWGLQGRIGSPLRDTGRKLVPMAWPLWGVKQVLFLWRVLVTEKPSFICRVRTSGPKDIPKGIFVKKKKDIQAVSMHDYLSRGALYISKKCSSPLMLNNEVCVSSAFQF